MKLRWGLAAMLLCADAGAAPCPPTGLPSQHRQLSQVLKALSSVHAFRLENWSNEDPVVNAFGADDVQLMAALAGQANLMVRYAAVKACPGRLKIDTIWILPGKAQSASPSAEAAVVGAPAAPTPADVVATKAAADMFLRAHGGGDASTAHSP